MVRSGLLRRIRQDMTCSITDPIIIGRGRTNSISSRSLEATAGDDGGRAGFKRCANHFISFLV
jgi:hypothetical protein